MYNNEITYNKDFDTEENRKALKKLNSKFFDRSYCAPDCPTSWAPEVLELLETINNELGIARNTSSNRGYMIGGDLIDWFIATPISSMYHTFIYEFFTVSKYKTERTFIQKVFKVIDVGISRIRSGVNSFKVAFINHYLNKLTKPKFKLDQIKEKYGELRIYYSCAGAYEEWVERQIKMTEIKLAKKGVYYPLESLYLWKTSSYIKNEHDKDQLEIQVSNDGYTKVSKTMYRELMSELGIDTNEVAIKAMILEDKKENA